MTTFALIKNGTVVNTIVVDLQHFEALSVDADSIIEIDGLPVGVGWIYDGENFISPYVESDDAKPL
jgi:hypothetical protein